MSKELSFRCEVRRREHGGWIYWIYLGDDPRESSIESDASEREALLAGYQRMENFSQHPTRFLLTLSTSLQPIKRPARRLSEFRVDQSFLKIYPRPSHILKTKNSTGFSVQRSTKQGGEVDFPTALRRGWRRRVRFRRKRGRGQVVKQLRCH